MVVKGWPQARRGKGGAVGAETRFLDPVSS